MSEHGLGLFSLETLITISSALLRLQVGRVAVASIQDRLNLLHDFHDILTDQKQSFLLSQFTFSFHSSTSANTAMPNFLADCNQFLLTSQKPSHFQIVIVLSDGVLNKDNVRPMLRNAVDKGLLYLFVILDSQPLSSSKSIFNKRSVKQEKGKVSFTPFLEDFPFPHYCILSHIEHLPQKIAACLIQWVEETQH